MVLTASVLQQRQQANVVGNCGEGENAEGDIGKRAKDEEMDCKFNIFSCGGQNWRSDHVHVHFWPPETQTSVVWGMPKSQPESCLWQRTALCRFMSISIIYWIHYLLISIEIKIIIIISLQLQVSIQGAVKGKSTRKISCHRKTRTKIQQISSLCEIILWILGWLLLSKKILILYWHKRPPGDRISSSDHYYPNFQHSL